MGLAGLIAGVPISYGLARAYVRALANEIYSPLFAINPATYMIGLLCTLAFLAAAQWKMQGKVESLSMLDVLKQQD